ncbi:probable LRR receptor-like serine/threonine-protein kinase at1g56130 [Phtheirospermum japonicum]|uniref:Probable LRR receptor-like serine/threonine-protein kinase at1g56130 n=1 Tax=Phtheirospermum japonicum TaxID=374723 RepID=A0A830B982_9LAMI|nr:probable LRR receptor-like serine/threonine-protein kinase at1g56130 [Phtheirospermum japonicum]
MAVPGELNQQLKAKIITHPLYEQLILEGTNLEGPIPSSFGALTKLELRIGDLGGIVDSSLDFVENMTSLSTLSLRNCRIGGQIQEKLSSLLKLEKLFLGSYGLSGELNLPYKSENNKFADLDPKTRSNVEKMMVLDDTGRGRAAWAARHAQSGIVVISVSCKGDSPLTVYRMGMKIGGDLKDGVSFSKVQEGGHASGELLPILLMLRESSEHLLGGIWGTQGPALGTSKECLESSFGLGTERAALGGKANDLRISLLGQDTNTRGTRLGIAPRVTQGSVEHEDYLVGLRENRCAYSGKVVNMGSVMGIARGHPEGEKRASGILKLEIGTKAGHRCQGSTRSHGQMKIHSILKSVARDSWVDVGCSSGNLLALDVYLDGRREACQQVRQRLAPNLFGTLCCGVPHVESLVYGSAARVQGVAYIERGNGSCGAGLRIEWGRPANLADQLGDPLTPSPRTKFEVRRLTWSEYPPRSTGVCRDGNTLSGGGCVETYGYARLQAPFHLASPESQDPSVRPECQDPQASEVRPVGQYPAKSGEIYGPISKHASRACTILPSACVDEDVIGSSRGGLSRDAGQRSRITFWRTRGAGVRHGLLGTPKGWNSGRPGASARLDSIVDLRAESLSEGGHASGELLPVLFMLRASSEHLLGGIWGTQGLALGTSKECLESSIGLGTEQAALGGKANVGRPRGPRGWCTSKGYAPHVSVLKGTPLDQLSDRGKTPNSLCGCWATPHSGKLWHDVGRSEMNVPRMSWGNKDYSRECRARGLRCGLAGNPPCLLSKVANMISITGTAPGRPEGVPSTREYGGGKRKTLNVEQGASMLLCLARQMSMTRFLARRRSELRES